MWVGVQLSAVKDACCLYMSDCLDEDSAAATLSLAAKYSCDGLQAHTQQYIVAKFHSMRPDALKECTRAVLWDLISRDDLSLHSELQVRLPPPTPCLLLLPDCCKHVSAVHISMCINSLDCVL